MYGSEEKMIPIDKLKDYSKKLEFTMEESEYKTLQDEFEILFKQVDKISEIEGLKDYEPMSFPFPLEESYLRSDEVDMSLSVEDALMNTKDKESNRVKLPRVVE